MRIRDAMLSTGKEREFTALFDKRRNGMRVDSSAGSMNCYRATALKPK
jgi:hypothetical protein